MTGHGLRAAGLALALGFVAALPAAAQMRQGPVNMIVAPEGIYLDGKLTTDAAALRTSLQILAARRPEPTIYVSRTPGANATQVSDAVDLCISAGLTCVTGRVPQRKLPY